MMIKSTTLMVGGMKWKGFITSYHCPPFIICTIQHGSDLDVKSLSNRLLHRIVISTLEIGSPASFFAREEVMIQSEIIKPIILEFKIIISEKWQETFFPMTWINIWYWYESGMLTRPEPHEAEATTHEAEATTHEAEAEAEAKTHLEILIIILLSY